MRQVDRQVFDINRANQPGVASLRVQLVQDRERLPPKTLPREQPVAQLVVDRLAPHAGGCEIGNDLLLEVRRAEAVVGAAVDGSALASEERGGEWEMGR